MASMVLLIALVVFGALIFGGAALRYKLRRPPKKLPPIVDITKNIVFEDEPVEETKEPPSIKPKPEVVMAAKAVKEIFCAMDDGDVDILIDDWEPLPLEMGLCA